MWCGAAQALVGGGWQRGVGNEGATAEATAWHHAAPPATPSTPAPRELGAGACLAQQPASPKSINTVNKRTHTQSTHTHTYTRTAHTHLGGLEDGVVRGQLVRLERVERKHQLRERALVRGRAVPARPGEVHDGLRGTHRPSTLGHWLGHWLERRKSNVPASRGRWMRCCVGSSG